MHFHTHCLAIIHNHLDPELQIDFSNFEKVLPNLQVSKHNDWDQITFPENLGSSSQM